MPIYRYGFVAWLWRLLAGAGLLAGAALAWLAWRESAWSPLAIGLPLALPALVLAPLVAVRIDRVEPGHVLVHTLAFWRRRIPIAALGEPRYRSHAQATSGSVHAPRMWVPVRGGLPVHVDLLGDIPDRAAFLATFALPATRLPRKA